MATSGVEGAHRAPAHTNRHFELRIGAAERWILFLVLTIKGVPMNRRAFLVSLITVSLAAANSSVLAQKTCEFNIVGTWKTAAADQVNPVLYRFAPDGTVAVLSGSTPSSDLPVIATATYQLDSPTAPKSISFTARKESGIIAEGKSSMGITSYDGASFSYVKAGNETTRLIKVDANQYFIVLAAQLGTFYDTSGPAFPMLIKRDGRSTQVDAVGVHSIKGKRAFGTVPPEAYSEFMKETNTDSNVMLRLEITSAQYDRGLKILRTWERRVREDTLFYPKRGSLDNVVLVRQVAESLNQCGEKVKLYNLNYVADDDWISNTYGAPFIPFRYFKELRRLNESLHVRDEVFAKSL